VWFLQPKPDSVFPAEQAGDKRRGFSPVSSAFSAASHSQAVARVGLISRSLDYTARARTASYCGRVAW
jgi:hypothetical protein